MYYPYSMQVTHFLKRTNCKVSLHFVKYVKSKETGKPVVHIVWYRFPTQAYLLIYTRTNGDITCKTTPAFSSDSSCERRLARFCLLPIRSFRWGRRDNGCGGQRALVGPSTAQIALAWRTRSLRGMSSVSGMSRISMAVGRQLSNDFATSCI